MSTDNPELIYLVLVIPSFFGVVFFAEGVLKILRDENSGYLNLIFGLMFFIVTALVYFFFNSYLLGKG